MCIRDSYWALLSLIVVIRFEVFQFQTLRYISNSPWFVKNDAISRGLKVTSLTEFVRTLAFNLFI